jgi:hypothetical protein
LATKQIGAESSHRHGDLRNEAEAQTLLTISLGALYRGRCYKLVAAASFTELAIALG